MNPFALGLRALFSGPRSVAVTYVPKTGPAPADPIRVIFGQPDRAIGFGQGQVVEGTNSFQIQRSDVALPAKGDRLTIVGGATFKLLGDPMGDAEGLTWTMGGAELAP